MMRPTGLAVAAILLSLGCAAAASAPPQFDLVCNGTTTLTALGRTPNVQTLPYAERIPVDLGRRIFCLDGCRAAYHFSAISPERLEYHYDLKRKDEDHEADRFRGPIDSSAGPFAARDDLTIDLQTGKLERIYLYNAGDPAGRDYREVVGAQCVKAPFTRLPG